MVRHLTSNAIRTALAALIVLILGTQALAQQRILSQVSHDGAQIQQEYLIDFALLSIVLNEENQLGSEMNSVQMSDIVRNEGINALAGRLRDSGEVSLISRSDTTQVANKEFRFFSGEEAPYLQTSGAEEAPKAVIQQVVNSGVTASLTPMHIGDGRFSVGYDVDADVARRIEENGTALIGRARLSWSGATIVEEENGAHVGKFVRRIGDETYEFIFAIRMTPVTGSDGSQGD